MRKNNIIPFIVIALLVSTAFYLTTEIGRNKRLEENLRNEKLTSESFLSEKLSFEKDLLLLKEELSNQKEENSMLSQQVVSTREKLETSENELQKLRKTNSSIQQLRKQNDALQQSKHELQRSLDEFTLSQDQLKRDNEDMAQLMAVLQTDNNKLRSDLNVARFHLNDALMESSKKNNKLTAKARQTKKLMATIDVPVQAENLKIKITSPDGSELKDVEQNVVVRVLKVEPKKAEAFYVAANSTSPAFSYKRVEVAYTPKTKLMTGTYKIEVLNDSVSIGSLQVRLM